MQPAPCQKAWGRKGAQTGPTNSQAVSATPISEMTGHGNSAGAVLHGQPSCWAERIA